MAVTTGEPVEHGTVFDIAWTGKAKSESMETSIKLAMQRA